MRNTSGPSTYRPQYVPAFQMNSDGFMQNNSAQTQAIVGLQNLLYERSSRPPKANESVHMQRRQEIVDDLLRATGQTERVKGTDGLIALPRLASPQPVLTGLSDYKNLSQRRALQIESFGKSFLGYAYAEFVYGEIDDGLRRAGEEKAKIGFFQRMMMPKEKYKNRIFAPLHDSIRYLNQHLKDDGTPLRIEWRFTKESSDLTLTDLYFIYPNCVEQVESGFQTWFGALDVVQP